MENSLRKDITLSLSIILISVLSFIANNEIIQGGTAGWRGYALAIVSAAWNLSILTGIVSLGFLGLGVVLTSWGLGLALAAPAFVQAVVTAQIIPTIAVALIVPIAHKYKKRPWSKIGATWVILQALPFYYGLFDFDINRAWDTWYMGPWQPRMFVLVLTLTGFSIYESARRRRIENG